MRISDLPEALQKRTFEKLFDASDLMSDSERPIQVWTDERYIAERPSLKVFSRDSKRTAPGLREGAMDCAVTLMYFDAMSTQDTVAG